MATIDGHETYYDDVKNMEGHIVNNVMKVGIVDPDEFNVLNHGDCWLSNIMFTYDQSTGKLTDTYLVDYQLPNMEQLPLICCTSSYRHLNWSSK